jgi:hypothetical protein
LPLNKAAAVKSHFVRRPLISHSKQGLKVIARQLFGRKMRYTKHQMTRAALILNAHRSFVVCKRRNK